MRTLQRAVAVGNRNGSASVTITGVSLKQTTKVTFGGVAATFTVNSDTTVTAVVPSGAVTGKIAVTTSGGTAQTATTFNVTQCDAPYTTQSFQHR